MQSCFEGKSLIGSCHFLLGFLAFTHCASDGSRLQDLSAGCIGPEPHLQRVRATLWTTETPIPSSRAIFRIPVPFLRCARIAASTFSDTRKRPNTFLQRGLPPHVGWRQNR